MKFLQIFSVLLLLIILCQDVCEGLFFKPWLKSVKKSLLFGPANYGYRNPYGGYGYGYGYNNYGYYGGRSGSYYRPYRRGGRRQRGGRSYSDIARVVNPNPYAFVGTRPYPGQPFYPFGG